MTLSSNDPSDSFDWLESLANHPITTTCTTGSQSLFNTNCIVYHDGLLILSLNSLQDDQVKSRVRILNLTEWKRKISNCQDITEQIIKSASYKELVIDALDFPVRQIALSPSGTLLALRGDYSVVVAVMPLSARSSTLSSVPCKSFLIGNVYYGDSDDVHLSKIMWHPLSETGSHLAILSTDGQLRLFDIAADTDEPESSFQVHSHLRTSSLQKTRRNTHVFGLDTSRSDPVSFDFGVSTENNGWESFTVYVLCRNADIYSICPFLPHRSRIPMSLPLQLKLENDTDWKTAIEKNGDNVSTTSQFYWRSLWIDHVLEQVIRSDNSNDLNQQDDVVIRAPSTSTVMKHPIALQGPYLLQPGMGGLDDIDAIDLVYRFEGSLSALLVSFESGSICSLISISNTGAKWDLFSESPDFIENENKDKSVEELPVLVVHDILNLDAGNGVRPCFFPDWTMSSSAFVYHTKGVDRIDLSWLSGLATSPDVLEHHTTCHALVRTSQTKAKETTGNSITGFALVSDIYLGHCFILLSPEGFLYGQNLSLRMGPSITNNRNVPPMRTDAATPLLYKSFIQNQRYTLPSILNGSFPRNPTRIASKSGDVFPDFLNEENISVAKEAGNAVREDIKVLYNAMADLQEHIERQAQEHNTQKLILSEINNRIESLSKFQARLSDLKTREAKLKKKAENNLEILLDKTQPALSPAEIKWMDELDQRQTMIKVDLKPAVKQLAKRWEQLKHPKPIEESETNTPSQSPFANTSRFVPIGKTAPSSLLSPGFQVAREVGPTKSKPKITSLGEEQQARLRAALKQEYQILSFTYSRLESLMEKMRD